MSARNQWLEGHLPTIDKLVHNLQEIQLTNSAPQIPFNLILSMIRGAVSELNTCQGKINNLTKELEELKKKTT